MKLTGRRSDTRSWKGVALGLADGLAALVGAGTTPASLSLVGGGSRSDYWAQLIGNTLNIPIITHSSGQVGAVMGAARLTRMAAGENVRDVCQRPSPLREYQPQSESAGVIEERLHRFRSIYPLIKPIYKKSHAQ